MLVRPFTTLLLISSALHASEPARSGRLLAANDNRPRAELASVCDETLSGAGPVLRIAGITGELVDRPTASEQFGRPRQVWISPRGVITYFDPRPGQTPLVRQSLGEDRPFDFVTRTWSRAVPPEASRLVGSSPAGDVLALADERKSRLWIVEAAGGRILFERTSFRREADGVHAHFNPRGRVVSVQRDGFMEIVDLAAGGEMIKGYSFGHAMKDDDGGAVGPRGSALQFEARGEIHVLSTLDRSLQFFKSEPLLLVSLGKKGTYRHHHFDPAPPTRYVPSEIPADLDPMARTTFRFVDRPNQTGRGFVSPRENLVAELRYQYHEPGRESFVDLFDISTRAHLKTIGLPGAVTRVAYSENERYLAVATTRRAIRVYDLRADHARAWYAVDNLPLTGPPDLLAFTSTGDLVVGSGASPEVWRYPLPD